MSRFRRELKSILHKRKPGRHQPASIDIASGQSAHQPFLTEAQQMARDLDDLIIRIQNDIEKAEARGDFLKIFFLMGYFSIMKTSNYQHMSGLLDLMTLQKLNKSSVKQDLPPADRDKAFNMGQAWAELKLNRSKNSNNKPPPNKQPPGGYR